MRWTGITLRFINDTWVLMLPTIFIKWPMKEMRIGYVINILYTYPIKVIFTVTFFDFNICSSGHLIISSSIGTYIECNYYPSSDDFTSNTISWVNQRSIIHYFLNRRIYLNRQTIIFYAPHSCTFSIKYIYSISIASMSIQTIQLVYFNSSNKTKCVIL